MRIVAIGDLGRMDPLPEDLQGIVIKGSEDELKAAAKFFGQDIQLVAAVEISEGRMR